MKTLCHQKQNSAVIKNIQGGLKGELDENSESEPGTIKPEGNCYHFIEVHQYMQHLSYYTI